MTEQEWLTSIDFQKMLKCCRRKNATWTRRLLNVIDVLNQQASRRKLSLFACACVRRLPYIDAESSNAIQLCERHADGLISKEEMTTAHRNLPEASGIWKPVRALARCLFSAEGENGFLGVVSLANLFMGRIHEKWYSVTLSFARSEESTNQSRLLRDIFGNPFRPVTVNPAWQTSTVIGLAQAAYDDRAFNRLPILADALEDTGCTNAEILGHCRGPGPHVRGCWVLDLLLGKE